MSAMFNDANLLLLSVSALRSNNKLSLPLVCWPPH